MRDNFELDRTDISILEVLQQDATTSIDAIAEQVSVSPNTCWRRIKRMEDNKIILGRVILIEPKAIGAGQIVFVSVRTREHNSEWASRFQKIASEIPEVIEIYRLAGDVDYLLKIACRDVAEYDRVYNRLINKIDLTDVSAAFAMECLKHTTALPLKTDSGLV